MGYCGVFAGSSLFTLGRELQYPVLPSVSQPVHKLQVGTYVCNYTTKNEALSSIFLVRLVFFLLKQC